MSRTIGRRELLQGLGALGATTLAGCSKYPGPAPIAPVPEGWARGEERWIKTSCGQCPAGCGIKVRVREGTALKIEGNPDHPINRGGLGPKGQAGLHLLYHPDRIRGPRKRRGPRGSGAWEDITWDEAIGAIARELQALRTAGRSHELVAVDGVPRGMQSQLLGRFLEAYGTPNHVPMPSRSDGAHALAMTFMNGVSDLPAHDWPRTRYVLVFGGGLLESWCQTIHLMRATTDQRAGTPGHSQKLVQVSPRFSRTAAKTDEWIPIEPGTYGMLALGLAHLLVAGETYDQAFVRDHCFGFDDWKDEAGRARRGFKTAVLEGFGPEMVAKVTGVPVETMRRLARELSEIRPAVAVADADAVASSNGLGTAMAIHALNALLGSMERPGGILAPRPAPLAPWPPATFDEVADRGRRMPRLDGMGSRTCALGWGSPKLLSEAMAAGSPYPVSALLFMHGNPVFTSPEPGRWQEAIERVPLVVSLATLPDESTLWADFVLPTSTYLEQWEVLDPMPVAGYTVAPLQRPVVTPVHDTLAGGDIVIRLARALGGAVQAAFPWAETRVALEERLAGLVSDHEGSSSTPKAELSLAEVVEAGGWWDSQEIFEAWDKAFPTPSGRFEFYSQTIATRLDALFPEREALEQQFDPECVPTQRDELCLPHWKPLCPRGDPEALPFLLDAYHGLEFTHGGMRHLGPLRELPGSGRWSWRDRIELNPDDAARLDIRQGDNVWVASSTARRRMCAVVSAGIRPGTLGIALGGGVWPPRATDPSGTHALLDEHIEPLTGIQSLHETRVRVWKERA